jgi:hypothetical protein
VGSSNYHVTFILYTHCTSVLFRSSIKIRIDKKREFIGFDHQLPLLRPIRCGGTVSACRRTHLWNHPLCHADAGCDRSRHSSMVSGYISRHSHTLSCHFHPFSSHADCVPSGTTPVKVYIRETFSVHRWGGLLRKGPLMFVCCASFYAEFSLDTNPSSFNPNRISFTSFIPRNARLITSSSGKRSITSSSV